MRLGIIPTLLLLVLQAKLASADPYTYTVLDFSQMIGAGRIDQTGSYSRGNINIEANPSTSPARVRGYGGWMLPPISVKIKEAWVIARVTPVGDPLPNPVGLPLEVHFITGAFDAARPRATVSEFQRLDDGPLIALPPARRESGNLVGVLFSRDAILWLESQRAAGMDELNLGFTEQAGTSIHLGLGTPYVILNPSHVPGDANGDGDLNFLDLSPFVASVLGDANLYESLTNLPLAFHDLDVNYSGAVNNLDIAHFVEVLNTGHLSVPEPSGLLLALLGSIGVWGWIRKNPRRR